jgi:hypothetical protein
MIRQSRTGCGSANQALSNPPDISAGPLGQWWVWTVSWMSMKRIGQNPRRGSGRSCRHQKTPVRVTTAAVSHMITPTARTNGVDPNDITMMPARATGPDGHPPVSAVLQIRRLVRAEIVPPSRDHGRWSPGRASRIDVVSEDAPAESQSDKGPRSPCGGAFGSRGEAPVRSPMDRDGVCRPGKGESDETPYNPQDLPYRAPNSTSFAESLLHGRHSLHPRRNPSRPRIEHLPGKSLILEPSEGRSCLKSALDPFVTGGYYFFINRCRPNAAVALSTVRCRSHHASAA